MTPTRTNDTAGSQNPTLGLAISRRPGDKEQAMKRVVLIFLLLLVCIGCDQGSKYTAKRLLEGKPTLSYMGDVFRLIYTENRGAFLGLGAGVPVKMRFTILVVMVSVFLIGFLLFIIRNKNLGLLTIVASTFVIGGGLGNLIDRIIHKGSVIDFMNLGLGPVRTGIFNIADVAIMAGGITLAAHLAKATQNKANSTDS
jgi:signal peptidase II